MSGEVAWVPDAPGADLLVVVGAGGRAALVRAADATVEAAGGLRPDALARPRQLRRRARHAARPRRGDAAAAWYVAQALLAAESLGAVEVALEVSVQYAKERFTFGRAIGSYQAVKHDLVEILRRSENSRSLMYYTGWAGQDKPEEFPVAASVVPARRRPGARPRGARPDLRPRRHRRDLGARRAAVLPPRPAVTAAAGRDRGRGRPRGGRAARRRARDERQR